MITAGLSGVEVAKSPGNMTRNLSPYAAGVTSDPTDRLAALLAGTVPMALDEAMILIAVHADPRIRVEEELARLDELAAGVEDHSAEAVRSHLFDELGFAGDGDTYYSPANSLLPSVVDRRTGIPITL